MTSINTGMSNGQQDDDDEVTKKGIVFHLDDTNEPNPFRSTNHSIYSEDSLPQTPVDLKSTPPVSVPPVENKPVPLTNAPTVKSPISIDTTTNSHNIINIIAAPPVALKSPINRQTLSRKITISPYALSLLSSKSTVFRSYSIDSNHTVQFQDIRLYVEFPPSLTSGSSIITGSTPSAAQDDVETMMCWSAPARSSAVLGSFPLHQSLVLLKENVLLPLCPIHRLYHYFLRLVVAR